MKLQNANPQMKNHSPNTNKTPISTNKIQNTTQQNIPIQKKLTQTQTEKENQANTHKKKKKQKRDQLAPSLLLDICSNNPVPLPARNIPTTGSQQIPGVE